MLTVAIVFLVTTMLVSLLMLCGVVEDLGWLNPYRYQVVRRRIGRRRIDRIFDRARQEMNETAGTTDWFGKA